MNEDITIDRPPTSEKATVVALITQAKGDVTLRAVATVLLNRGDSIASALRTCKTFNQTKLEVPFDPAEVEQKVQAVFESAKRTAELAESDLTKVLDMMNQKYAWLIRPMAIFDLRARVIVKKEALKSHYANTNVMVVIDGKDKRLTHFDAWMQSSKRREHSDVEFFPGEGAIVNNHVNLWIKWGAAPVAGDVKLWTELLDYMFGAGKSERLWIEQWLAYPLQNPGAKMHTAVLIWSARTGVGKSLMAETIGKLYGDNFRTLSAQMLKSRYNGWAQNSLLILAEENANNDLRADSDMLKQLITGKTVDVEEKYRVRAACRNQMNLIMTSNHPDAFHLEIHDRRYFVWSIDVLPKERAFYDAYVEWASSERGLPALMHHLRNLDLSGFDPHGHAPMTNAKLDMIEHSKTDIEKWLTDALTDEYIDGRIRREIVTLGELVRLYQQDTGAGRTTPKAMGLALRRQCNYEQNRVSVGSLRPPVVSLRNHDLWAVRDGIQWTGEYTKASPAIL